MPLIIDLLPKGRKKVYYAIKKFIEEKGYSPTIRELMELTGFTSSQTIQNHLKRLRDGGYIKYEDGKSRTIVVAGSFNRMKDKNRKRF